MKEIIKDRIKTLKKMNNFFLKEVNDEENIEWWLEAGVPDNPSEEDFEFIALDDEEYNRCCRLFCSIFATEYQDDKGETN